MSQSGAFGGGNSSLNVQTITGNTGGAVAPTGNNIDLIGDGIITVDGDAGTSTVALNISDAVATKYTTDSGDAVAANNTLVISGDSVITTSAFLDTVTVDMVNGTDGQLLIGGGTEPVWADVTSTDGTVVITPGANTLDLSAPITFTGNLGGPISPVSNNIDLLGNLTVVVTGNPLTNEITFETSGLVATEFNGDTGFAIASGAQLNILGDSVITTTAGSNTVTVDMVNGTDGQLLIGGGTEATWANLTSADGSVTITEGPNSIDLQVAGGGGGVATITAGANITTTVAGSDVTVAVTDRIDLPATNSAKTQGVLAIGDCEFFTYGIDINEPNSNIFIGQNMPSTAGIDDSVKGVVCIGSGAMGAATTVQDGAVAIGYKAMENGDSSGTIAIGSQAMRFGIADNGIAIGELAMSGGGGQDAIAIGTSALGYSANCDYSIAMGHQSMLLAGSGITNAVSIGFQAMGFPGSGGNSAIAIGKAAMSNAGGGEAAIAMGDNAMQAGGGIDAIAIGRNAMLNGGGADDIAIGRDAMRDAGAGGGDAIAIGHQAMQACASTDSIAIGHDAMRESVSPGSNVSCIAIGRGAMELPQFSHTNSVAIGNFAMQNMPSSFFSVAIGNDAMRNDASGNLGAVAIGANAMGTQASGSNRLGAVAIGESAMGNNGGTRYGIAIGFGAMLEGGEGGISGDFCIAIGYNAMEISGSGGDEVIAIGLNAMNNKQGSRCVAIGTSAAAANDAIAIKGTSGVNCISMLASTEGYTDAIAIGRESMRSFSSGGGNNSIAIGAEAMQSSCGANSIAIGLDAGKNTPTTSTHCIYIGSIGDSSDPSGTIRLGGKDLSDVDNNNGPTYIAGIRGVTTNNNDAVAVLVDSAGQLGTVSSSIRYKENVQTLGDDSDVLQKLRPVSFTYKNRPADRKEYGFIAEEVAEHIPDIVVYDDDGQPETIQYHKLYGLMVSEIQRNHQKIKALEERLADLEAKISIRLNLF